MCFQIQKKFGSYNTLFSNARTVETQLSGISIQSFATNVLILYRRSRRQQKKLDHVFQQDISNCAAPGNYEGKGLFSNKSQHIFTLLHRFLIFSYFFALKSYPCKFYELIEFRSNQSGFSCFQMAIQCLIFIHFRKLLSGQKSQTFVLKIPTKKKSQIFCIFSVLLLVIFIGRRKRISKKRRKVLNDKKVQ